jgi:AraC-like DNA-binding protein
MVLFLSITGIVLSGILVYFNARKFRSSVYLGVFFFLVSLYGLIYYMVVASQSVVLVSLFMMHPVFLTYLAGPSLYLYFRSLLTDDPRLKRRDFWHGLPAAVFLLASLPWYFTPWPEKLETSRQLVGNIVSLRTLHTSLLYDFINPALVFLSRPLLLFCYAIAAVVMLIRLRERKMRSTVLSQQRYMTIWLTVLLVCVFIMVTSHMVSIFVAYLSDDIRMYFTLDILQMFSAIGLTGLLISPFFFPSILYGMPRYPSGPPLPEAAVLVCDGVQPAVKHGEKKDFEADYLLTVGQKVERCMADFQPYLQQECNLACVARITAIPAHHLAYYFREVKNQPFNDYRNTLRVEHAKKLMAEGRTRDLTLEAIGLLSGFATRNTFYNAFRRVEGVAPGVWVERLTNGEVILQPS